MNSNGSSNTQEPQKHAYKVDPDGVFHALVIAPLDLRVFVEKHLGENAEDGSPEYEKDGFEENAKAAIRPIAYRERAEDGEGGGDDCQVLDNSVDRQWMVRQIVK